MDSYRFVNLNDDLLISTSEVWKAELQKCEEFFSPIGYESVLDSLALKLKNRGENMFYFALVNETTGVADALVVCSHALPRLPDSWVKVLAITMSPIYDPRNRSEDYEVDHSFDRYEVVSNIIANTLTNLMEFTVRKDSKKLKIYANPESDDISILQAAASRLKSQSELKQFGITVDTYKNWLEFRL